MDNVIPVIKTSTRLLLSRLQGNKPHGNLPEPSQPCHQQAGTFPQSCLRNLHQHTPELSASGTFQDLPRQPTPAYTGTLQDSKIFRSLPELAPRTGPTFYTGTLRNLPEPASGTYTSIRRNSPEPSGTCLRNLHQHTPELSGTFRNSPHAGTLRNLPEPASGTYTSIRRNSPPPEPSKTFRANLRQHTPEPSRTPKSSGAFRNWPPEPDLHFTPELSGTFRNLPPEPTPAYAGTLRNLPEPASGTYTSIRRNFPEPSGTRLTPELSGTFRNLPPEPTPAYAGTFRNLPELASRRNSPEPSGTPLRNLQQHTTEPSRTFRNLPPEPAPATRTGTHRSLSGLKTPLAYAVGEKVGFIRKSLAHPLGPRDPRGMLHHMTLPSKYRGTEPSRALELRHWIQATYPKHISFLFFSFLRSFVHLYLTL